jgi:hypothetical protein
MMMTDFPLIHVLQTEPRVDHWIATFTCSYCHEDVTFVLTLWAGLPTGTTTCPQCGGTLRFDLDSLGWEDVDDTDAVQIAGTWHLASSCSEAMSYRDVDLGAANEDFLAGWLTAVLSPRVVLEASR